MKVAIVHSLDMHYELLPFFVEFARVVSDWEFDFYMPVQNVSFRDWASAMAWLNRDMTEFRVKPIRALESVTPGTYDVFVIPTNDERAFRVCERRGPVVFINHGNTTRKLEAPMLNIRPLADDHGCDVCMTCFTLEKTSVQPMWLDQQVFRGPLKNQNVLQVLVVGFESSSDAIDNRALNAVMDMANVQVTIVTRSAVKPQHISNTGNVPIYIPEAPAHLMLRLFLHCDYVLVPQNGKYLHEQMTGVIPLALSFQKPMIMPTEMANSYGFDPDVVIDYEHMREDIVAELTRALSTRLNNAKIGQYANQVVTHSMTALKSAIIATTTDVDYEVAATTTEGTAAAAQTE